MKRISVLSQWIIMSAIATLICVVSCQPKYHPEKKKTEKETPINSEGLPMDLSRTSTPKEAAEFAWKTFLAISEDQPAGQGTKWENYKEAYDVFLTEAQAPSPWGDPTTVTDPPCAAIKSVGKILRTTSKVSPVINETNQAVGGVLIDRNSNLVHYEVYMNRPMFEYIVDNKFYNALHQAGSKINFPVGSMELKASWRILDISVDDTSRYHTSKAIIYIPDSSLIRKDDCLPEVVQKKMEVCSEVLVGLVGLHIVYKTPSNPHFTWMTFEQIDNVRSHQEGDKVIPPSFRNDEKVIPGCPDNSRQCDCPKQETSQITRQIPIPMWVSSVNETVQDSLRQAESIWAYYELVGIQWAQDDSRTGNPILANLGNTSMETFNQTSSSCIGCHAFARSSNPTIYSDFSWVMGRAQNPKAQLPDTTGRALLQYVMRVNPYKAWKTWPDSEWNIFSKVTAGENPHGVSVRIYVNDIAIKYYNTIKDNLPAKPELPIGSIVLKENYRSAPTEVPQPSDLVELTIMYKAMNSQGKAEWFWMKTRPYGPVDMAGFDKMGCVSCHMNWEGNGDGMLSFNFGRRPVITEKPYKTKTTDGKEYSPQDIEDMKKYLDEEK